MYHVSAASQFCRRGEGGNESAVDQAQPEDCLTHRVVLHREQHDATRRLRHGCAKPARSGEGPTLRTVRHRVMTRQPRVVPTHSLLCCSLFSEPGIWGLGAAGVRAALAAARRLQWPRLGGGRSARSSRRRRRAMRRVVLLRPTVSFTMPSHRLPSARARRSGPLVSRNRQPTGQGAAELRPEAGPPRCTGRRADV